MNPTTWRGVAMPANAATLLESLETETTNELWLYTIVRALRPKMVLAVSDNPALLLWLAIGVGASAKELTIVTTPQTLTTIAEILDALLAIDLLHILTDLRDSELPPSDFAFLEQAEGVPISAFDQARLVITPITTSLTIDDFNEATLDDQWRLLTHLERRNVYIPAHRDQAIAILLNALQPQTLVLGMNVVFDGAMKPLKSKINFSGVGGQIGFGDVLICHPDDLNRFTPLPGAIALVLGEVTEEIQAFSHPLHFGDDILTIVLK